MATLSEKRRFLSNWYLFVRPIRDMLLTRDVTAMLRDGTRMCLRGTRSSDFFAMTAVLFDDVYQMDKMQDPKIILDIGANIGAFAIHAARKFPKAHIIAVEPEPENAARLRRNISLNDLSNIEVRECAVSKSRGTAMLYLDPSHPSAHSLRPQNGNTNRRESIVVETVPLSSFGPIDALKIDCEGAEVDILDGNIPDCQYVAVEFDTSEKDNIIRQFREHGYALHAGKTNNCVFTKTR